MSTRKFKAIVIEGQKVTQADVENCIVAETFIRLGKKIVVCHLTLSNGFEVIGNAGVVDPKLFDMSIGSAVAREQAVNEVWGHLGSLLQNQVVE